MQCVQALSDASQDGVMPPASVLEAEENTFNDLTARRQALVDALSALGAKKDKAG